MSRKRSRAQRGYYADCFSVSSSFFFRRQFLACRGGSGDLLTGILGAYLQKNIRHPDLRFPGRSLAWPGRRVLARQNGQEAVYSTDLLDFLSFAIRNDF